MAATEPGLPPLDGLRVEDLAPGARPRLRRRRPGLSTREFDVLRPVARAAGRRALVVQHPGCDASQVGTLPAALDEVGREAGLDDLRGSVQASLCPGLLHRDQPVRRRAGALGVSRT